MAWLKRAPRAPCPVWDVTDVSVLIKETKLSVDRYRVKSSNQHMACSKLLSFAGLVKDRENSVRVTNDGYVDVVDTVRVVTGKDCNQSNETLRLLKPSLYDKEKFFMRDGRRYASPEDIIALIMVLPGNMAKGLRNKFAKIIVDYFEIKQDPVTGAATVELKSEPVEDAETRRKRERREDLELLKLEEEIREKRINNLRGEQDVQEKRIKSFQDEMAAFTQLRPDWKQTDTRFRMQTEDMLKNIIMTPVSTALVITNGSSQPVPQKQAALYITDLAKELGCKRLSHGDSVSVGKKAAKRYKELHGSSPPKQTRFVDGAERSINSYTEEDREMLVSVLKDLGLVPGGSSSGSSVEGSDV